MLAESEGEDQVVIFCKAERAVKRLPKNANIQVEPGIFEQIDELFWRRLCKSNRKTH